MTSLFLIALEALGFFIGLTIYGAMWHGAQLEGRRGWAVALLWTVILLVVLQGVHSAHDHAAHHQFT